MARWTDVSDDPNSREALQYRTAQLARSRQAPVADRAAHLVELARGRRVLDIGCVNHVTVPPSAADLHRRISAVAAACRGVDVLADGVESLQRDGYDATTADVTAPNFEARVGGGWELIVAGEVIEHLTEPCAMLDNARRVLAPDGQLVLTSPNPHSLRLTYESLRGRIVENVDHVTYLFPSGVAELADRTGFMLKSWRGARSDLGPRLPLRRRVADFAARGLVCPEAVCWSLVYVLEPTPHA
jgi:cyclopropane fatty-acyl-phospholipid synthase-like methyltransferase